MLDQLRRAVQSDPDNIPAQVALAAERARVEGADVLLEPLADRELWNATSNAVQDLAIGEVARRLAGFELAKVRVWDSHSRQRFLGGAWRERIEYLYGGLAHRLATFTHSATGIEMNLVPGGVEWADLEPGLGQPRAGTLYIEREVAPFLIGRWPVTNGLSYWPGAPEYKELPMVEMSHRKAEIWCDQYSLRLPTAAEWQHACRAGATTRFYWGDEMDGSHCWHAGNGGENHPLEMAAPVSHWNGPHPPREHDDAGKWNAFGLVDMIGNVWECLSDGRVIGGGYETTPDLWLADELIRGSLVGDTTRDVGFRAVCSIPASQ